MATAAQLPGTPHPPGQGIAVTFKPVRKGMSPADPHAAGLRDGGRAIEAPEDKGQQTGQFAILQGQQFFPVTMETGQLFLQVLASG